MEQQTGVFAGLSEAYLLDAKSHPRLTEAQEITLAKRRARGDKKARRTLIVSNLLLVLTIAKEYRNCGVDIADLIAEGNVGLVKAVDRFSPDRGAKFSTYAAYWIRCYIRRALSSQSRCVRLTNNAHAKLRRLSKCRDQMVKQLGRFPNNAELANELGWTEYDVEHISMCNRPPKNLDEKQFDDPNGESVGDSMADEESRLPDQIVDSLTVRSELDSVLAMLDERDARIVRMRFGLDGGEPMTLEDVGRKLGITRERVRQLVEKVFRQLRVLLAENPSGRSAIRLAARTHVSSRAIPTKTKEPAQTAGQSRFGSYTTTGWPMSKVKSKRAVSLVKKAAPARRR